MQGLAQAIATRARPILQSPTPGPEESHDKTVPQVTTQADIGSHQPTEGDNSLTPTLSTHTPQSSPTGPTPENTTPAIRVNRTTDTGAAGPEWEGSTTDTHSPTPRIQTFTFQITGQAPCKQRPQGPFLAHFRDPHKGRQHCPTTTNHNLD